MERKHCRVWWPRHLLDCKPRSNLLLFGWCIHSLNSLDIVLAHANSTAEISVNILQHDLQEILRHANKKMPVFLQESSTLSILGICILDKLTQNVKTMGSKKNGQSEVEGDTFSSAIVNEHMPNISHKKLCVGISSAECFDRFLCGCTKLDPSIDTQRQSIARCGNWIQLIFRSQRSSCKEVSWIPEYDHIHQNGVMLPITNFHLIIYDLPSYGRHHYTLSSWGYSNHTAMPFKKPILMSHLHQKPPFANLETIMYAINCSDAAKQHCHRHLSVKNRSSHSLFYWLSSMLCYMIAISVALISSVIYFIIQLFHMVLNSKSHELATMILKTAFRHAWKNVHIRSCQFLYWPIVLLGNCSSSYSNAEFAHRDAVRKHSLWSAVAVDVLLGSLFGLFILANNDYICFLINYVVRYITENLLRSGCVWLMGIPAGFKLNTELAELFGMVSLNAIQTFSTLWLFVGSFLQYFIRGLALFGFIFGLTVPAALCIDVLKLLTLHVFTLHWLISFIYLQQIQAMASLWRIFRGRKWNPLRQRLDNYEDYTVEQHVVGSLLFTLLFLLLPTTSVFYIFFTLLSILIDAVHFTIEMIILVLHVTPYVEILLWLARRERFPSGIWIEIISGTNFVSSLSNHELPEIGDSPLNSAERTSKGVHATLISILRVNHSSLGKIVLPCYARVFEKISSTFFDGQLTYGILSGRRLRVSSCFDNCLPSTLPWMQISYKEYWRLCYCSISRCSLSQ